MKPIEWISVIILNLTIGVLALPRVIWLCPTPAPQNETVALQQALCRHIADYYQDCGPEPAMQSLNELLSSSRACAGDPYVHPRMLKDAWAQPILIQRVLSADRLISAGADRVFQTQDDLGTSCQTIRVDRSIAQR